MNSTEALLSLALRATFSSSTESSFSLSEQPFRTMVAHAHTITKSSDMDILPGEIDLSMDDSDNDSDVIIEENVQEQAERKKEEGNQFYKMKQYKQALALYSDAIALCPENPAYYGNRAACYVMLLQYKDALTDSRKAIELDPKFVKGYLRMAKCYLALGDVSASNSALQRVSELEPNNPSLAAEKETLNVVQKLVDNASKCYEKGDFRQVVYCMDMALNSVPGCHRFKLLKAECLALIARYQEAQEIANDVLRFDSQNADAIYVRAMCLYYQDGLDKAFSHLTHILKIAPDHKKALDLYKKVKALKQTKEEGNNAFSENQWQRAYELYSQALLIDPTNAAANTKLYSNRALASAKMNKLQQAVDDCTEALKLDETFLKALLRRAKWYTELGLLEEAVYDYEKVCKLDKSRENKRLLQEAKLALKRSKWKDYYKILGVERSANDDEIRKAYRKRALVHHPDKHASKSEGEKVEQEKKFKEIGEAYAILSDPKKRARYDSGQDMEEVEFENPWAANPDACGRFPGFFGHSQQQFVFGDGYRVFHLG